MAHQIGADTFVALVSIDQQPAAQCADVERAPVLHSRIAQYCGGVEHLIGDQRGHTKFEQFAVAVLDDLDGGDQVANRIGGLVRRPGAGWQIVENRYGELLELGVPTLIADQVFHAAAVLGDPGMQDWRSLDIGTLRGRLLVETTRATKVSAPI